MCSHCSLNPTCPWPFPLSGTKLVVVLLFIHILFGEMDDYGPARKKRRGGIQQRVQAATPAPEVSALAGFLLYQLAWGVMSPQLCQKIASLALDDFERSKRTGGALDELEKFAAAGTFGRHCNNVNRSVMAMAGEKSLLPQPFKAKLDYKMGLGEQTSAVLLPHEMFSAIYECYPEAWQHFVAPGTERLEEFWESQAGHPQMAQHPLRNRRGFKRLAVPIAVHGDEVPLTGIGKCWSQLLLCFSWFSLVAEVGSATKSSMVYIWSVFDRLRSDKTMAQFTSILTWSLFWMWKGVWPDRDHEGKKHLCLFIFATCICALACVAVFWGGASALHYSGIDIQ